MVNQLQFKKKNLLIVLQQKTVLTHAIDYDFCNNVKFQHVNIITPIIWNIKIDVLPYKLRGVFLFMSVYTYITTGVTVKGLIQKVLQQSLGHYQEKQRARGGLHMQ